jgi:hypothetical protein
MSDFLLLIKSSLQGSIERFLNSLSVEENSASVLVKSVAKDKFVALKIFLNFLIHGADQL